MTSVATPPQAGVSVPSRSAGSASERALAWALRVMELGPILILVTLMTVMSILSPVFLTQRNLTNLGVQTALIAVLGVGMLLVVLTRGIDLSMGSVVALSGVMGAAVAGDAPGNALVVIAVMLGAGAAFGLVNGVVLVKGRVPHPFIVTLATLGLARGAALLVSHGSTKPGMPNAVLTLGNGELGPIPYPVILAGAIALVSAVMTTRMVWGRWIYAVGGDPEAARRAGIPVDRVLISVYVMAGIASGVGGLLTAAYTNAGSPTAGNLLELDAITAVIIGGASFFGGRGNVGNVLVGALVLGVIRNGLNLLDVDPYWQLVTIGTLILVAIELDVLRGHLEGRLRVAESRAHNDEAGQ